MLLLSSLSWLAHSPLLSLMLLWVYSSQYSASMRAFASDSDSYKLTDNFHEGSIKHHFSRVTNACSVVLEMHKLNPWSGKSFSSRLRPPLVEVWKLKLVFLSTIFTLEYQLMLSSSSSSSFVEDAYRQIISNTHSLLSFCCLIHVSAMWHWI